MHTKLNNLVCSLFVPYQDDDPEIQFRLSQIHGRWDRYFKIAYYEQVERQIDFWDWFDKYMVQGESTIYSHQEFFKLIRSGTPEGGKMKSKFLEKYPLGLGHSGNWLIGAIWPTDFDDYLRHLQRFNVKYQAAKQIGEFLMPSPYGVR